MALACTVGTPTAVITGNEISVPPPAIALTMPAPIAATAHTTYAPAERSVIERETSGVGGLV